MSHLLDLTINILGLLDSATCLECPRGRRALCQERKKDTMSKLNLLWLKTIDCISVGKVTKAS